MVLVSSHVKITCYLDTWKDHRCYGYIINRAFCNDLVFHWCSCNKQNITWPPGDTKFLFSSWNIITCSLHSLMKYFSTLEEKFRISARSCNILYVSANLNQDLFLYLKWRCHGCNTVFFFGKKCKNLYLYINSFPIRELLLGHDWVACERRRISGCRFCQ